MNSPAALAHEAIYDSVINALAGEPRGRIIDVPAGQGALAQMLAAEGFDVSCCDLFPEIFALDGLPIKRGNLDEKLPYDDGSFEHAVCVEGLEHIENPANAIRELARVLQPGGSLIVSVPNIMNIEERLKWVIFGYTSHFKPLSKEAIGRASALVPGREAIALHINPIGYSELRYILENSGFALETVFPDKPKRKGWIYWPVVAVVRLIGRITSQRRRRERWTDELNSREVLTGGNTLILKARKL